MFLFSTSLARALAVGDRVQSNGAVNVRSSANSSISTNILGEQSTGARGTITGGPQTATGFTWWQVNWDSGPDGWCIEPRLDRVVTVAAPGSFSLSNDAPVWDNVAPAGPAVRLTWTAASGVTMYQIYRNGSAVGPSLSSGTTSFYNSTGLSAGQTYSYYVVATNTGGTTQSSTINVSIPTNIVPVAKPGTFTLANDAPVWDAAAPAGPAVRLTWTAASGATTYQLYRNGSAVGPSLSSGTTSFYNSTGLSAGQSYSYYVVATNTGGTTQSSTINVSIPTSIVPVAKPGTFTLANDAPVWDAAAPAGPAVRLTWTAASGATTYQLYRNGSAVGPSLSSGTTSFYNSTSLSAGQSYSYYVVATNTGGTTQSSTINVSIPTSIVPSIQPDLVVSALAVGPAKEAAGKTVKVTGTVTNNHGGGAAAASVLRIRLAAGATITTGDPLLAALSVPALAAGASHPFSQDVTIPSGTSAGNYFVGATANADAALAESNDNNNQRTTAFTVTAPDAPLLAIEPASVAVAAAATSVSLAVRNAGSGTLRYAAAFDSRDSWLRIASGATGAGGETISLAIDANPGSERQATLTVTANGATAGAVRVAIVQAAASASTFYVGSRIRGAAGGVNARRADLGEPPLFQQEGGVHGTIVAGPQMGSVSGSSQMFWEVRWDWTPIGVTAVSVWSADSLFKPLGGALREPSALIARDFSSPPYAGENRFFAEGNAPTSPADKKVIAEFVATALGNCTWYAYGRLLELGYDKKALDLIAPAGKGRAGLWGENSSAHPPTGEPAVGSIAWSRPQNHVAVVEAMNPDGSITLSESSYVESARSPWNFLWRLRTVEPTDPVWGWRQADAARRMQFIVVPRSAGDTQGPLLALNPVPEVVSDARLTISGTATDKDRGGNGVVSVTANGVAATGGAVSGDGIARWSATLTLQPGSNSIAVEARDATGKTTTHPALIVTLIPAPGEVGETANLGVLWLPSPNFSDRPPRQIIDAIVIHTVEGSYASGKTSLRNPDPRLNEPPVGSDKRVSAHYLISPEGEITQLVALDKRAWHATYYNDRSIGIEMAGFADRAETWNSRNMEALANLVAYLIGKFRTIPPEHPNGSSASFTATGLVGHSQVQPGNKSDPGPHFDWAGFVRTVQSRVNSLRRPTSPTPPVASSRAGPYFGSFGGNAGTLSAYVGADQKLSFLGFMNASRLALMAQGVALDPLGRFRFTTSAAARANSFDTPPRAAAAVEYTVEGSIDTGGLLTGTVVELGVAMSGTRSVSTGATPTPTGFFQASAPNTSATTYFITGPAGQAFVLTVTPQSADGGMGTIDANNRVAVTTAGNAQVAATVQPQAATITASVTSASGQATSYSGGSELRIPVERLVNLSSRARTVASGAEVLIAGFVVAGETPKQILVRGIGPALGQFGVGGALSAARLELFLEQAPIASNAGWSAAANATAVQALSARVGAFPLPAGSGDAVLIATLPPGAYTATLQGSGTASGVSLIEVYDATEGPPGRERGVVNISIRGRVGVGDDILIAGIVISGEVPKRVLVRGIGPGLAAFGVPGTLADPQLRILRGATAVAANDDWNLDTSAQLAAQAAREVGAFDLGSGSKDAALLLSLLPGAYTVQISGANGATGIALAEIYELR